MAQPLKPESGIEYPAAGDGMTDRRDAQHRHEIGCAACGKTFYADRATASEIARQIEHDLDNPFLCDDCRNELEERLIEER